jgi:hypothetical protein
MPEDLETLDDEQQPDDSPVIRDLRKQAKESADWQSKAAALERELVVHKAGLSGLTDKQHKALAAAHEGDWEPEALKATAAELGFGPQPEQPDQPQIPADEMAAMQRVATAQGGQPPPPPTDLDTALANAQSEAEVLAILQQNNMLAQQ